MTTSARTRIFAPLVFWVSLIASKVGRLFGRPTKVLQIPKELTPIFDVATLSIRYSEYMDVSPDALRISDKMDELIHGRADQQTLAFVHRILGSAKVNFDEVYNWLIALGDAAERDREPFRVYLTLPTKTNKNKP